MGKKQNSPPPKKDNAVHPRRTLSVCLSLAVALLCLASSAFAQEANARISGIVTDPTKAVITGVNVVAVNVDTKVRFPTKTNSSGVYVLPALPIGDYRIEIEHVGFKSIVEPGITLHTQDALEVNFEMALGSASETVTVNAGATNDSPAVSMTVNREFVENMPLNGRSFQDLVQLAPGTASTANGYYIIDGQREDSNNYTVDGLSANLGGINNLGGLVGIALSGSVPSQTALGTTQSLASVDSLQEFTIQTSGYTAEYGRNPGGQVQLTTRSGANALHGTLFEYLRNTVFDANSYQNDVNHTAQTAERQNDFGGTIGGPLIVPKLYDGKNKTFYFVSYEGLRLDLPATESEYVPTQAFRNAISSNAQPFLNTAPLPNSSTAGDTCTVSGSTIVLSGSAGPSATPCDELFATGYSYPEQLDSFSIRVDQNFSDRIHTFLRYADTPSWMTTGFETIIRRSTNSHAWTGGLTASLKSNLTADLRFNSSRDGEDVGETERGVGGGTPLTRSTLIPASYDTSYATGEAFTRIAGTALVVSDYMLGTGTILHQYQLLGTVSWTKGMHAFKFGGDWRRISSMEASGIYTSVANLSSVAALQQGYATSLQVSAANPGKPVFDNLSLFAQDHFRVGTRVSIDYGVRWEFDPPPGPSNGAYPVTLTSSNLTTATLAPTGTAPYKTHFNHFAPRLGFAWQAIPSQRFALTVRGGAGIFFDTGQQSIGESYAEIYLFNVSGPTQSNVTLPLTSTNLAPPSLNFPLTAPYPYLQGLQSPDLTLPYAEQWNLSLDQALGQKNTLTASYVGNNGKKLLFSNYYSKVPGNSSFTSMEFENNASSSYYDALQVQDVGRVWTGVNIVGSFTWAHALDNATSYYAGGYAPFLGNPDYDLRRVLNLAINYQTGLASSNHLLHVLADGWTLSNRFAAQSGYPLNIFQATVNLPNGGQAKYSPNLVPNVPIYLHGAAADINGSPAPGNWRLNPAAFSCVPTGGANPCIGTPPNNGNLGRNYIRNPAFWDLNTSVQRSFPIFRELHLLFRLDAFNVLNHPNPGNPITSPLTSAQFGELNLGNVTTIGSGNALYAMGASRSLQFSLKLQF